jgi:hypothetical protein
MWWGLGKHLFYWSDFLSDEEGMWERLLKWLFGSDNQNTFPCFEKAVSSDPAIVY